MFMPFTQSNLPIEYNEKRRNKKKCNYLKKNNKN